MEILRDAVIPAEHPCLAGHFPGNPVVPGTLILEQVLKAIEEQWPEMTVSEVVNAKFVSPLKPGEPYRMRIVQQTRGIQFDCSRTDQLLATGRLATVQHG